MSIVVRFYRAAGGHLRERGQRRGAAVRAGALALCLGLGLGSGLSGCSGSDADAADGGEEGSGGSGGIVLGSGGSAGTTSGSGGTSNGMPGSCNALSVEGGCSAEVFAGEAIPLDIYIMFDQSGSMATVIDPATQQTRLDAVLSATELFLNDPESAGISVGIGYFGYQPLGATTCDPNDYNTADVAIDLLPGNADAVVASLSSIEATGETPTGAAIRGACQVAEAHKATVPGHSVVILLVTDGEPKAPLSSENGCSPTLEDAQTAATECFDGDAEIPTYVLGVGPSLGNLDGIAVAGGTDHAYLVGDDTAESSEAVLAALNAIRGAAQIPCDIEIAQPSGDEGLNYSATDVVFMNPECEVSRISRVETGSGCDGSVGGWYFDDVAAPTRIILCEASCGNVKAPGSELFYSVGCNIEVPR